MISTGIASPAYRLYIGKINPDTTITWKLQQDFAPNSVYAREATMTTGYQAFKEVFYIVE